MKIVVATRNAGKVREFAALLADVQQVSFFSMAEFADVPDVVEDGETFLANAEKKAVAIANATGLWALADDSGLEVDALGGAPGVHSARYAGVHGDDGANNAKLLTALADVDAGGRTARFRCVLTLAEPAEGADARVAWRGEGVCEGHIAGAARGEGGFGYDPLFVPRGHGQTFGELPVATKNALSHRAQAARKFAEWLRSRG